MPTWTRLMDVTGTRSLATDRCHCLIEQPVPQRNGTLVIDVGLAGCCCAQDTTPPEDRCITPPEDPTLGIKDVYICP